MSRPFGPVAVVALALVLLSTAVHWPSESAQFTYDDRDFIERNQSIRSLGSATAVFFEPFPVEQPERGLYRPLTNLSYAFDYALSGRNAAGYHLANVSIYAAIVGLVFALAWSYVASPVFAGSAALAFSLHPVHSDAVDSLAGRSELLALLFCIASLLLFIRASRSDRNAGPLLSRLVPLSGSVGCYALACLSKETGVVLPAIIAVHALVFGPGAPRAAQRLRLALRTTAPYAVVLLAYGLLRMQVLRGFSPEHSVLGDAGLATRIHTMGAVFAEYARLLLFPDRLQIDYVYQRDPGLQLEASPQSLVGWALAIALIGYAIWLFAAQLRRGDDEAKGPELAGLKLCALAVMFGFFLPVSHLLNFGALMAERFLFSPSLGFVLLIALSTWPLWQRGGRTGRTLLVGGFGVLAIAGALRSGERAAEWRDEVALWESAATATHDDPRVFANLGAAYLRIGKLERARVPLIAALELDPGHTSVLHNLAYAHLETDQLAEASQRYRESITANPNAFVAWNGLGVVAARQGDPARAAAHFARALEINPNFATAQSNLDGARVAVDAARRFVDEYRLQAATSNDPQLLARYAQACHAAGNYECADRFAALARLSPPN